MDTVSTLCLYDSRWMHQRWCIPRLYRGVWRKLEKSGENCKSGGEKRMYVYRRRWLPAPCECALSQPSCASLSSGLHSTPNQQCGQEMLIWDGRHVKYMGMWRKIEKSGENCKSGGEKKIHSAIAEVTESLSASANGPAMDGFCGR